MSKTYACVVTLAMSALVFTLSCASGFGVGAGVSAAAFLIALAVLDT